MTSSSESASHTAHPGGLYSGLNPRQIEAVKHLNGPILVVAGAGTGKTRVLTRRVAALILEHKIRPDRILAVTFTNKATEEMRHRLRSMLGESADQLWVATFHSASLRILRRHCTHLGYTNDFVVYDDDDSKAVMKRVLKEHSIDEKRFAPQMFLRLIDQAKNEGRDPDDCRKTARDEFGHQFVEVFKAYQEALKRSNAMDFGDLLVNALALLKGVPEVRALYQERLQYVLVDEFQDTNAVQYEFVRILSGRHKNLLVVGDDDQSIYKFRGATIANLLHFERDFPEAIIVTLDENYRSTPIILEASHGIISQNKNRRPKKLWTSAKEGELITACALYSELDEGAFVAIEIGKLNQAGAPLNDMAIFYRTNAQSRAIEEALLQANIPYRIFGGLKFYERKEIKDMLAYLRVAMNPQDVQAFIRSVNTPVRGIGPQALKQIQSTAELKNLPLLEASRLLTGKSKGLAAYVALIDAIRTAMTSMPLSAVIEMTIKESGYLKSLTDSKDSEAALARRENLQELIALGRQLEVVGGDTKLDLQTLLDRATLTAGSDSPSNEQGEVSRGAVSLMTLHLAKGLEFSTVFFTGFEDGLVPHYRSIFNADEIEEERRLCYVGFTRAKQKLYVTRTMQRGLFSSGDSMGGALREVSRFVHDVPGHLLDDVANNFKLGSAFDDEYILNKDKTADETTDW